MLTALAVALATLAATLSPLALPPGYHDFADRRSWLGVPNAADVLSNLGFALVGLLGLAELRRGRLAVAPAARGAYALFFSALLPTALGSAWYHLAPDDGRLLLDRAPIVLCSAALMAAALAEARRPPPGCARAWPCAALAALGLATLAYAHHSGDLAPYLVFQLAPLALLPLVQTLYPTPARQRASIAVAIVCYLLARGGELADRALFDALGVVSGHTLKHLFVTLAVVAVWRGLPRHAGTRKRG
ncbi:hypothetical protein [Crenobacter luteus]|uniref:hypothetical protein n=1 Tax=Crenobacter luteus TaxID=1452487 RepID=UPI00104E8DA2|nr:hypothetical protein [Crenobacter luteus]